MIMTIKLSGLGTFPGASANSTSETIGNGSGTGCSDGEERRVWKNGRESPNTRGGTLYSNSSKAPRDPANKMYLIPASVA